MWRLDVHLHHAQAELKVGEKLSDYPDYYRVLQASDGSSVALSKYLDKSPVTSLAPQQEYNQPVKMPLHPAGHEIAEAVSPQPLRCRG